MPLLQVIRSTNLLFKLYLEGDIENVIEHIIKKQINSSMIGIHCHDTFGQALANILMAMEVSINYSLCISTVV